MTQRHAYFEKKLRNLRDTNPREAAEIAYALAKLYQQDGDNEKAIQFGREAINLLDKCPTETLEDCNRLHRVIKGISIPDLIHQAVVRERLQPLAL